MAKVRKPVTAREIRTAFREGKFTAPEAALKSLGDTARGRLHPQAVEAYLKAHRGRTYAPTDRERKVEVPVTKLDKRGRRYTRSQMVPVSKVREVAGIVSRRGRLPNSAIEKMSQHLSEV